MATVPVPGIFIVESGAKCKTIQKYLPANIKVLASLGHVCDLPAKKPGYDSDFTKIDYVPIPEKRAVIKRLVEAAKGAEMVYLAMDPDREGCAIAEHLRRLLKLKPGRFRRVTFNEITKEAILNGVKDSVGEIDTGLFGAQEGRRVLDRVVGYEVSPLLWKYFSENRLSAGRVQSATLGMVVAREKERKEVRGTGTEYWTLKGTFDGDMCGVCSEKLPSEAAVEGAMQAIRVGIDERGWCPEVEESAVARNPPAPYTTSSLQQDAWTNLRMRPKATMIAAQALYEAGHITYMRTDSVTLSKDAQNDICSYVSATYGADYVHCRQYKTKTVNAQEAHEAIRPTRADMVGVGSGTTDDDDAARLYKLIWNRAVGSQMRPARFREWKYTIQAVYTFVGTKSVMVDAGFMILAGAVCPELGTIFFPRVVHFKDVMALGNITRGPVSYNDATIIKAMETAGIGRPSTYAPTLDKLMNKGYICKSDISEKIKVRDWGLEGKIRGERELCLSEKGGLVPTAVGESIYAYLMDIVPFLLDCSFTSKMEAELDRIAKGDVASADVLREFYATLKPCLIAAGAGTGTDGGPLTTGGGRRHTIEKTRYGVAVKYIGEDGVDKYLGLDAYMKWCNKPLMAVDDREIDLLLSLPRDGLAYGRYGLYTKEKSSKKDVTALMEKLLQGRWEGEKGEKEQVQPEQKDMP